MEIESGNSMPINNQIKLQIDNDIILGMNPIDFRISIHNIIRQILYLGIIPGSSTTDMLHTSAYLIYRISTILMRSTNQAMQLNYGNEASNILASIYNSPIVGNLSTIATAGLPNQRTDIMRTLINFYNFHYAFLSNSNQGATAGTANLLAPRRTLEQGVNSILGPFPAIIRQLPTPANGEQHIRLYQDNIQGDTIEIGGSLTYPGQARNITVGTWNLQGQTPSDNKWLIAVLSLARGNDFVLIQEAGSNLPVSFGQPVQFFQILDQFGIARTVDLYRWNAGSSTRQEVYNVYFYNVGRARVNLAIVTAENSPLTVREPIIISDLSNAAVDYRPLLGLRIQGRNAVNRMEDIVIYNFHSISGGGPNAPRMVREAIWHTDVPIAILGDFNRDPRPNGGGTNPGPWIQPPDYATIDEATGPTHPATGGPNMAMLDYAVTNGVATLPPPGAVLPPSLSDHLAVTFQFDFPS